MTARAPECDAARRLLPLYLDGELVDSEVRAVDEHLAECDSCRELFAREKAVAVAIAEGMPRHRAPAALDARVQSLTHRHPGVPSWAWLAASAAVLLIAGVLTWRTAQRPREEPATLTAVAVDAHLRFADGRLPLDVHSERSEDVSRWFEGRVPFHVTIPAYPVAPGERKYYTLEGARLVTVGGEYAAYLAYRMDGRPISLLIASADRVHPSGRDTVVRGHLVFHCTSAAGLNVISWTDNGLTYALVSDVAVSSERSCMVCHGKPEERDKIEGIAPAT